MSESILSLLQQAESERAAVEQQLRAPQRNANQLRECIINAQKELAELKTRRERALETLSTCEAAAKSLEASCDQFAKAQEGMAARISDLSMKIYQEKCSRLQKYTSAEEYLSGLRAALRKVEWSPEALERLAAAHRTRIPQLEQQLAELDASLQSKKAKLEQAQSTQSSVAEDGTFVAEEQQAMLKIFKEDVSKIESTLKHLESRKEHLQAEVDRLGAPRQLALWK
ncbi:hypothetical protein MRX96_020968 [Rhipicephalus microplus]